jgi:glutathione peroxidase
MASAYDFSFKTLRGETFDLGGAHAGKPLLVVNTASKCGFTPQYAGLQSLWQDFKESGLVVIGVPSNDFGNQEPGTDDEIGSFCEVNYGVGFPMMEKVHVKGPQAHPFFTWVGGEGGFLAKPRWNFYKYLIGRDGQLADWFTSTTKPDSEKVKAAVAKTL